MIRSALTRRRAGKTGHYPHWQAVEKGARKLQTTGMIDQPWSRTEKELARELFDEARERERQAILREIHSILNAGKSLDVVWDVHDYLTKKRREMDEKYDFRYSQMIL